MYLDKTIYFEKSQYNPFNTLKYLIITFYHFYDALSALSPNFVRQHIIDGEDANLIESDLFGNKTFATNQEDCKIVDSSTGKKYMPHGDITEVTYLSDGKFLNSTLWINDYINLDNPLYPEGIDIARYPNKKESLDRFMDNFIEDQISMMKSKGDILTAEYNKSNNKNVPFGNETALKSEITITRNNPSKTEEKFLMIFVKHKSDIYQFSFSSLSHRYEDLLDEIENVTKSFHFVNTDQSASLQNRDNLYKNNDLGISFEYSPNYTIIDKPWGITILFPSNRR
jgi:hypothetical protein